MTVAVIALAVPIGAAEAATGPSTSPPSSWDDMQKLEYNIGRIATALELCRRYGMSRDMTEIAKLTPYGKLGMAKMRNFDGINGCGSVSNSAEQLLEDKDKLIEFMRIKYDCSSGDCVER